MKKREERKIAYPFCSTQNPTKINTQPVHCMFYILREINSIFYYLTSSFSRLEYFEKVKWFLEHIHIFVKSYPQKIILIGLYLIVPPGRIKSGINARFEQGAYNDDVLEQIFRVFKSP